MSNACTFLVQADYASPHSNKENIAWNEHTIRIPIKPHKVE